MFQLSKHFAYYVILFAYEKQQNNMSNLKAKKSYKATNPIK